MISVDSKIEKFVKDFLKNKKRKICSWKNFDTTLWQIN